MESTFKILAKAAALTPQLAASYKPECSSEPESHLERFLFTLALKQGFESQPEVLTRFLSYMSENRGCRLAPDLFSDCGNVQVMVCSGCHTYNFDAQSRAYCIYGKAGSLMKRKGRENEGERSSLIMQVEEAVFQLLQQGIYPLGKNESHDTQEILLHLDQPDDSADPVLLSNQVFFPFVPQPYALVLVIPVPLPRPDQLLGFLRNTLLHVYVQQAQLINRITMRENFYKNSVLRGIYFVQEGEVESTGGRVVARGWVSNGKCRSSGYGWRFRPLPFLRAIARNEHVWKQFLNDLQLNEEYPFKIGFILGLEEEPEGLGERKGRRGVKLPRIGHSSFDHSKLTEIEKMRHYDERMNDICDYKEKLLQRKVGGTVRKPFDHFVGGYEEKQTKRMLLKHQSSRQVLHNSLCSSHENILIMSVLKKLEGLTEMPVQQQTEADKRDKFRISPAHLYEKARYLKKKRYNQ